MIIINVFIHMPEYYQRLKFLEHLLEKAVIADGCIIHAAKIERSVIGVRSRIGAESTVINSYMMGNDCYESLEDVQQHKVSTFMGIGERCFIKNANSR